MDGYKHYVRTDKNGLVILGFTTGFPEIATPQPGDLLLSGQDGRHFSYQLMTERGQYRYKVVNGAMVERTKSELDTEWSARPPAPPTEIEQLKVESQSLDERTVGMQAIDDFTLQAQATIDERTVGMQEIDDFTLLQVVDLQQQVDQLKADVAALKGGA